MVDGYGYHLPDRIIKPAKMVQTPTAGVLFLWVWDSRVSGARGATPCCGKAANVGQEGSKRLSLCRDKPSAERTHPQGCISAPTLCQRDYSLFPPFGAFFSDKPALPRSSRQAGERRRLPRRSWSWLPAQCSQRPHPGRSADGCASCVPLGITFAATPFPGFQAAGFSSSVLNLGLQFLAVFFFSVSSWVVTPFYLSA